MQRPSQRLALDIVGVICAVGFLSYFGIYSPIQEGDPTPRGGRHSKFSIVSTYAIASFLLIVFSKDAIKCLNSGMAFVAGRSTRHRLTLRTGDRRMISAIFLSKGDSILATVKVTGAPTDFVRCRIAIEKDAEALSSRNPDELEAETTLAWESDDPAVLVLPSCKYGGKYSVIFTVEADQAGDVESMVTLCRIPAIGSLRIV